jgi:hypothetical protein
MTWSGGFWWGFGLLTGFTASLALIGFVFHLWEKTARRWGPRCAECGFRGDRADMLTHQVREHKTEGR